MGHPVSQIFKMKNLYKVFVIGKRIKLWLYNIFLSGYNVLLLSQYFQTMKFILEDNKW